MSKSQDHSPEQVIIRDIFEPLTHIGHPRTPEKPAHSQKTFIKRRRKPLTFGLQDDAACLIPPENKDLVISKDMLVEGVHFIGSESPHQIALKALRVNLSDIASKGAETYGYLLGLALGEGQDNKWLASFAEGLEKDQKQFEIPLLGGDITKTTGPLIISVTILGLCDNGSYVSRSGAQLDDIIYVTGTIGDSALGLRLAQNMAGQHSEEEHSWISDINPEMAEHLIHRYQIPQPRNLIAPEITQFCTSAIDISDGLLRDSSSLCIASRKGAVIEIDKLPLSEGLSDLVAKHDKLIDLLISGGDDYEILCTVPNKLSRAFEQACQHKSCPVTAIGKIKQDKLSFLDAAGNEMSFTHMGYSHL